MRTAQAMTISSARTHKNIVNKIKSSNYGAKECLLKCHEKETCLVKYVSENVHGISVKWKWNIYNTCMSRPVFNMFKFDQFVTIYISTIVLINKTEGS